MNIEELRTFSPSQMRSYVFCPQQWDYIYNKDISKSIKRRYFDVGNYFHELLHVVYQTLKAGRPNSEFLQQMIKSRVRQDLIGENLEVVKTVLPKMLEYICYQMPIIDKNIQVLEVEYEFKVPVTTPNGHTVALHGFVDLIYKDSSGTVRIRDHKSGERSSHSPNSVKLDDQLLFYAVAISLARKIPVLDVEISFLNSHIYKEKRPSNEMFQLYRYQHTEKGLALAKANILAKIDQMLDSQITKNYSTSCPSCVMFDICTLEMRGLSTVGLINSNYETGKRAEYKGKPKSLPIKITIT